MDIARQARVGSQESTPTMKEKNFKKKLALKKAKEKKMRQKALHHSMAEFLFELHYVQIPDRSSALKTFMWDGWKGYKNRRGRELVGEFEEEFKRLNSNSKDKQMVFYKKRKQYGYEDDLIQDGTDAPRLIFLDRANALMNQLIELAFDLDYED